MTKTTKRRRRESKTDYKARLALLKSGKPRLVVRKTNRYIIVQLVESDVAQDKVVKGVSSKELLSYDWPKELKGSLKSLPAAYLTGYLLVKKLKTLPDEAILDMGMNRNIRGSRIFSALKGAIDAGLNVKHSEKVLPSVEKLTSTKIEIGKIKEKI